jgi:hypothetical protein
MSCASAGPSPEDDVPDRAQAAHLATNRGTKRLIVGPADENFVFSLSTNASSATESLSMRRSNS